MNLSKTAVAVLRRRYLLKDDKGRIIENPAQLFMRVAREIAKADARYGLDRKKAERD